MREAGEVDYAYELTQEELRRSASLSDLERLVWLDEARRFTLLARAAKTVVYRAGEPVGTCRTSDDAA